MRIWGLMSTPSAMVSDETGEGMITSRALNPCAKLRLTLTDLRYSGRSICISWLYNPQNQAFQILSYAVE